MDTIDIAVIPVAGLGTRLLPEVRAREDAVAVHSQGAILRAARAGPGVGRDDARQEGILGMTDPIRQLAPAVSFRNCRRAVSC